MRIHTRVYANTWYELNRGQVLFSLVWISQTSWLGLSFQFWLEGSFFLQNSRSVKFSWQSWPLCVAALQIVNLWCSQSSCQQAAALCTQGSILTQGGKFLHIFAPFTANPGPSMSSPRSSQYGHHPPVLPFIHEKDKCKANMVIMINISIPFFCSWGCVVFCVMFIIGF